MNTSKPEGPRDETPSARAVSAPTSTEPREPHRSPQSPGLSFRKKAAFTLVVLAVVLCLLEAACRLAGLRPKLIDHDPIGHHLIADPLLGFVLEPRLHYAHRAIEGSPTVTTDEWGLRTTANKSEDGSVPAIVCLGDSTTCCAEVNDEQTWPSELAKRLQERFPCQVVNAGVICYNTVQSRRMLERALQRLPKARLAIYTYCSNDFVENLNPFASPPLQAPTVWKEGTDFNVVEVPEMAVPWGSSFKEAPLPTGGWPKRCLEFARQRSALVQFVLVRVRAVLGSPSGAAPPPAVGPRGSIPSSAAWDIQVAWARQHHAEEALASEIREMNELCTRHGVRLLVSRFAFGEDHVDLAAICQRLEVEFFDPGPWFTEPIQTYKTRLADGREDGHYNAKATAVHAEALATKILERREWMVPPAAAGSR